MEVANKIVMKKINEIKPYIRNPRKNDKTVEVLCKIIPQVGFNVPLVIDKNGVIVKGHSRFKAAIKLGMTELPCIITEADEEAIKLDRIADNRVSEFSEWLSEGLAHELDMITLDIGDLDFQLPSVADVKDFDEEFEEVKQEEDDEERRKRFQELLEKEEKKNEKRTEMTTEKAIETAKEKQKEVPQTEKYYKYVCEKCGHVMFVKASDLWDLEKGK